MFHLVIGLPIFLYLAWRLAWPLRRYPVRGLAVLAAVFCGAFKFPVVHFAGGPLFFAPDLPGWVLHLAGFWFGWCCFLLLLLLLLEPVRLWRKWRKQPSWNGRRQGILYSSAAVLAALLAGLGLYGGVRAPAVRGMEFSFPDLPAAADGLRLAVLSDLHAGPTVSRSRIAEFVRIANAVKPDAVLLTGDFMDGSADRTAGHLAPLADLSAPLGVWGVPGNHDYFYNYGVWRKILQRYGIGMLENTSVKIAGLRLAGVTDPVARRFGHEGPDLTKALANTDGKFTILLAHRPGMAPEAAARGVRLQFSGHTHGGMLPVLKWLVAGCNRGYVSGTYPVGGMTLTVSNGTGIWNGLPLRLGAPAELLIVTLRKK